MAKQIQLNIPGPCHEDWTRMTPAEKGRFCGACQKQVIDFTRMSDDQVAAFFKKPSTASVCGRFMEDQLNRDIGIPKKRIPWVKYFFQVALPAFLFSARAQAQGNVIVRSGDTTCVPSQNGKMGELAVIPAIEKTVRGKVTGQAGEPVPYASVWIQGTTIGTAADSLGQFRLKYEGIANITLTVSCIGFAVTEIAVDTKDPLKAVNVQLTPADVEYEEVIAGMVIRKEKKTPSVPVIQSIRDTLSRKFKLFPNPVQPGASLNIQCSKIKEGYYTLDLLTLSGSSVFRQEIWIDDKARLLTVPVPSVAAGTYLFRMVHKESGQVSSQKLIIQ